MRACSLAAVLGADADLLEAAAWLHDIGYSPDLAVTGLHALDGARYLRDTKHADTMLCRLVAYHDAVPAGRLPRCCAGWSPTTMRCRLVAYHSCAIIEAEERGLAGVLSPFHPPISRFAGRGWL